MCVCVCVCKPDSSCLYFVSKHTQSSFRKIEGAGKGGVGVAGEGGGNGVAKVCKCSD